MEMLITNIPICLKETRIQSYQQEVTLISMIAMAVISRTAYPTDQLETTMTTITVVKYYLKQWDKELNIIMIVMEITRRMELEISMVLLTMNSILNNSTGCLIHNLSLINARASALMMTLTQETSSKWGNLTGKALLNSFKEQWKSLIS